LGERGLRPLFFSKFLTNLVNRKFLTNFVNLNRTKVTNSEFTSRVVNGLNSLSKDDRISRRYILHVGKQKSMFYISQKLNDRSLFREDNIYTTLDCFEVERIESVKCDIIEFRKCNSIMKSKKKLPKLIYSRYGNTLKEVTTIDGEKEFKATTPSQYRRDKNRVSGTDYINYYVKDGYLYLLDTEIEIVNLYLLTVETEEIDNVSACSTPGCKSLWEYDFVVPDKLEELIVAETVKEIAMKKQIPSDENPNLNNNEK
jgi:hypothetical protein